MIPRYTPEVTKIRLSFSESESLYMRAVVQHTDEYPCLDRAELRRLNAWSADDT